MPVQTPAPSRSRTHGHYLPWSVVRRYCCPIPGKQISGVDLPGLLALLITVAVVLAPMLLSRNPSAGESDPGTDDDGGGGPPPPRTPPDSPGSIPLHDADPARVRLRNHDRLSDLLPGARRRDRHEPARSPTKAVRPASVTRAVD